MAFDEFERLFEKCIHCGMHTIWKIDDIPVCRACAKELEADPTTYLDKSDRSAANN
jgi:hypothetical protein